MGEKFVRSRRSRRIWKIVAIILAVIVLVNIFIAVFFSVPDLDSNTQNNPPAINDETISIDELRFIILLLARWTCPNNRPTYPTQELNAG